MEQFRQQGGKNFWYSNDTVKSQMHCADWKKPKHILCDSIHKALEEAKLFCGDGYQGSGCLWRVQIGCKRHGAHLWRRWKQSISWLGCEDTVARTHRTQQIGSVHSTVNQTSTFFLSRREKQINLIITATEVDPYWHACSACLFWESPLHPPRGCSHSIMKTAGHEGK